jgi:hypothetical protein
MTTFAAAGMRRTEGDVGAAHASIIGQAAAVGDYARRGSSVRLPGALLRRKDHCPRIRDADTEKRLR